MMHRLKYSRIERERRFLLVAPPRDDADAGARHIEDRYLDGTRLRLRRAIDPGDGRSKLKLTQKVALDSRRTLVTTIDLDEAEYERLVRLPGAVVVKHRHHLERGGLVYGVDVFEGPLAGLVLAEVEVSGDAALEALPAPPFSCVEVTDRVEFTGASLAYSAPAATLAQARRLIEGALAAVPRDPVAPTLLVRELRMGDAGVLAALFAVMGWQKPAAQFRRYRAEHRAGTRVALVAERDGDLAGYVTVEWAPAYAPFLRAGVPEIQDLNVLQAHRRCGVATALLDEAEARIASRSSAAGIAVGLHPGYNAAQRLYGLRGYVADGRGVTYRGVAVAEGDAPPFDDDLVLHLVKPL